MRKGCDWTPEIAILPQFLAIELHFVRKGCDWTPEIVILPHAVFLRSNFISCERVAIGRRKSQFYLMQFLAIEPHFVRKGCDRTPRNRNFTSCSFWRSNLISCERVATGTRKSQFLPQFLAIKAHFVRQGCAGCLQIAILPQFLAIEPHFVRKGCVSYRLVGTAPRLQERNRKEGESKKAREQEGKRARGQERM